MATATEKLLHPRVLEEIEREYHQTRAPLFVAEVPLLFESGWEAYFDETILAVAPQEIRARRFMKKDFLLREERFWPDEEKRKRATHVIENVGTLEELKEHVQNLLTN